MAISLWFSKLTILFCFHVRIFGPFHKKQPRKKCQCNVKWHSLTIFFLFYLMTITFLLNLKQKLPTLARNVDIRARDDSSINGEFLFKVSFPACNSILCCCHFEDWREEKCRKIHPSCLVDNETASSCSKLTFCGDRSPVWLIINSSVTYQFHKLYFLSLENFCLFFF